MSIRTLPKESVVSLKVNVKPARHLNDHSIVTMVQCHCVGYALEKRSSPNAGDA